MLIRPLLCAAISLAAPLVAHAQPADFATRRLLIEQAQERGRAGDHDAAITLGERALRIQSTPSLLLFLASEQLAAGRPHAAFGLAEQCVFDANRTSLANRDDVLRACRQVIQQVRDDSAILVIRSEAIEGLVVMVDGQALASTQLGAPVFVRAGARAIRASANGYETQDVTVDARARSTIEHTVALTRTTHVSIAAPRTRGVTVIATTEPAARRERPRSLGRPLAASRSVAAPIAVTATGAAAMLAAVPLFFARQSALEGCVVEADAVVCESRAAVERVPTARTLGAGAIAALVGGGAIAATGAVWWLLGARRREAPIVALGPSSITVAGVWR
ncbi:MAG: hypothetical protein JNK05_15975 [Myxococcales bacterium]|nr:hypothetical protein [Myxococcales bacterium]